jgi:hypothetical protein
MQVTGRPAADELPNHIDQLLSNDGEYLPAGQ